MPKYIKWPKGELLQETVELLSTCGVIPSVLVQQMVVINIPIIAPVKFHTDYFNRKGWHSIILQGVVDACYLFTDINVGWPGSVHDARVFSNSQIFNKGQLGRLFDPIAAQSKVIVGMEIPVHLIGDPAYTTFVMADEGIHWHWEVDYSTISLHTTTGLVKQEMLRIHLAILKAIGDVWQNETIVICNL